LRFLAVGNQCPADLVGKANIHYCLTILLNLLNGWYEELEIEVAAINQDNGAFLVHKKKACKQREFLQAVLVV
jgi:hypothetical protein